MAAAGAGGGSDVALAGRVLLGRVLGHGGLLLVLDVCDRQEHFTFEDPLPHVGKIWSSALHPFFFVLLVILILLVVLGEGLNDVAIAGACNIGHFFPPLNFIKFLFLTFRFYLAPLAFLKLRDRLATRDLPVLQLGDGFVKIELEVTPELPALMIRHSGRFRLF